MFSERLNRLRRARGISQEELAGAVGVSRQAVQKWESGAAMPDVENLVALCGYFGVTLDELVRGIPAAAPAEERRTAAAGPWHYEYKSRRTLFGLPLVHVNLGFGRPHWARGIIAIGNVATGVLALGGVSVGVLALGGVGAGLLALGGMALGAFALGGVGIGLIAVGGVALGWLTVGGVSLGTYAVGGVAAASRAAVGGVASAPVAVGKVVDGARTFALGEGASLAAAQEAIAGACAGGPGWLERVLRWAIRWVR